MKKQRKRRMVDLYRPELEHDACGVGLIVDIQANKTHGLVRDALRMLENLAHRGAEGADSHTGDGAGILTALPHELFAQKLGLAVFELPRAGDYGVAMVFLPRDEGPQNAARRLLEECARDEGLRVLGWRDVPVDASVCGHSARAAMPAVAQMFVGRLATLDADHFERQLFVTRKQFERRLPEQAPDSKDSYVCSFSSRTIVFKGLLTPAQLPAFYADLRDPSFASAFALVHQRFSTNTFPSWKRAHPYRLVAHNGEINTLRGNVNWMRAREEVLAGSRFAGDIARIRPVIDESGSDSSMFDNALELLSHSGRSVARGMTMLMPEAWENDREMDPERRALFAYQACFMEPWDGPAAMMFADGKVCGAALDRNGLRPARVTITTDGRLIVSSEMGAAPISDEVIAKKNRLRPGQMILVDLEQKRLLEDDEIKAELARALPHRKWLDENVVWLHKTPELALAPPASFDVEKMQCAFGYTSEELRVILRPMAEAGEEPVGSMGNDAPPAFLSQQPRLLFDYFRQLFAQVTNPPIDALREARVMSLGTALGAEASLFEDTPLHCQKLVLQQPILSDRELAKICAFTAPGIKSARLDTTYAASAEGAEAALAHAIDALCDAAVKAVDAGATILVLSDRETNADRAAIPSLLAVSSVHHHLIRAGRRTRCGLIVESAEPREVMHFCLLLGYGAGAVSPYLALASVRAMAQKGELSDPDPLHAEKHFIKAIGKGVLKVMSKMGISTLGSYRGAQIFEALGLEQGLVDRYFTWTPTRLEAVSLAKIADAYADRHALAFSADAELAVGGVYQWRRNGEHHAYRPETIGLLQHAVRSGSYAVWKRFSAASDEQGKQAHAIRGLLQIRGKAAPIPLAEVEPASSIVKRFKTGAMSLGSLSREAHETLAIAMNRIGGRSNTGEGGEDPARYVADSNGDSRRSAIKQVASGRFGVTMHYLTSADELQIKMAQGAKPGEGGQLPGHKVSDYIAELRCATPGVTLISPPPHHDIYSIEDLAQLIHDLKCANNKARVSVKLVAEVGVGTVAAGVAKAGADVILVSGDSGGTGAAPVSGIKHAGIPWELGLAEAQQVLVKNGLRERVVLETDGQLKTGRDVVIAAMLGADELGFATAALVATGCVLMRVCHLNTCPVGIATQDPELRKRFAGEPEHVINFMTFVAEEVRELLASLGMRTFSELVGRADLLVPVEGAEVDLRALLHFPENAARHHVPGPKKATAVTLDDALIAQALPALLQRAPVSIRAAIRNVDRTVGTRLSSEVVRAFGARGLDDGAIDVELRGTAGQSFGAFVARGVTLRLEGEANDYFGKGLSGGRLVVFPPRAAAFSAEGNVIVGNVALYGATSGDAFVRGEAGERFCVRNSGATAVVEGVGDHGCEYMTGGIALVLGPVGKNFAAGMSGGIAYVYDPQKTLARMCNLETVLLEASDEGDLATIRALLRKHYDLTDSQMAWRLLADFAKHAGAFVRVMPTEYKRALERGALARQRAAGASHG
ncbi:MAG: glutamate synthase large subunit [Deltaproteobacteria bacterium]|nr:glutamate synthase large subunit [Deltaproteobacteria bacterium]